LKDIIDFGLTNKFLSQSLQEDSPLWEIIGRSRYSNLNSSIKSFDSYKEAVKKEALLKFDINCLNANSLSMIRRFRINTTIRSKVGWITIRATREITNDSLYAWECILDHYYSDVIFVGLSDNSFLYSSQDHTCNIIRNTLLDRIGKVHVYDTSGAMFTGVSIYKSHASFQSGDIIRCVIDTRYPLGLEKARFRVYKVDPSAFAELKVDRKLDLRSTSAYHPVVSIHAPNQITIRGASTTNYR
jgi:hypothetical protein